MKKEIKVYVLYIVLMVLGGFVMLYQNFPQNISIYGGMMICMFGLAIALDYNFKEIDNKIGEVCK